MPHPDRTWDPGVAGSTVVVTGASSGIGARVAELLRRYDARAIGLDIRPAVAGQRDDHIDCDLGEPGSIDRAAAMLPATVHGLVNAAGLPGTRPDELVFRVNVLGLRHLTEALLPRLPAGSSVVHVSSTAGSQWATRLPAIREFLATSSFEDGLRWFADHTFPGVPVYNLTKEIVCVYAMRSALTAVERGIRTNAVSPGPVQTPILPEFVASMGAARLGWARSLAGRHAEPDDIAQIIVFLLASAAHWINGANLVVDGGITGAVLSGEAEPPPAAAS